MPASFARSVAERGSIPTEFSPSERSRIENTCSPSAPRAVLRRKLGRADDRLAERGPVPRARRVPTGRLAVVRGRDQHARTGRERDDPDADALRKPVEELRRRGLCRREPRGRHVRRHHRSRRVEGKHDGCLVPRTATVICGRAERAAARRARRARTRPEGAAAVQATRRPRWRADRGW